MRALTLWRDLGGLWDIADCLESLAMIAIDVGKGEHGVRILAAAAHLRDEINAPLAPYDQADIDREKAKARLQIGDEVFAAAEAAGHHVPLEEAIAEALSVAQAP